MSGLRSRHSSLSAVIDPLRARYLIAHKIASGGFGEVYAAIRKKDGMPVALKVVPKKRMKEIQTVSGKQTDDRDACVSCLARWETPSGSGSSSSGG